MKIDTKTLDFTEAPVFRKLADLPIDNVCIARGGEIIETKQKGENDEEFTETMKEASPGDAIVTREANDVYIIDKDKFNELYVISEDGDRYISTNVGRAIFLTDDTTIDAPWGEEQHIKAGGVLFKSDVSGDVYGNQAHSFNNDFVRVYKNGNICSLKNPLIIQEDKAKMFEGEAHLKDIRKRMRFSERKKTMEIQRALKEGLKP